MSQTMTWVGLDVHTRSTHAAAISTLTGELTRARFGPGVDEPVVWLTKLEGPVRACYEAGPTGYGLYRAAASEGLAVQVIAPGKTPRGPSDRVKTDKAYGSGGRLPAQTPRPALSGIAGSRSSQPLTRFQTKRSFEARSAVARPRERRGDPSPRVRSLGVHPRASCLRGLPRREGDMYSGLAAT